MIQTIGMLEFNSIAKGIETCDVMLKAAEVSLIRASTVCPGKNIIIITGDTGSVKASILAGEMNGGECVVDKMTIQNVHPQLIPALSGTALSGTAQVIKGDAIGAMEFYSITSAIKAADVAAKAAQISLVGITMGYAVGGKGIVTLTGDVGAVRAAVAAGIEEAARMDLYIGSTVIPKYAPELFDSLL